MRKEVIDMAKGKTKTETPTDAASRIRRAIAAGERVPGRKAKFRGKNRSRPIQLYLTDGGLDALDRGCTRTGLSRPDYVETLIIEKDTLVAATRAGMRRFQEQRATQPATVGTG
jgi:hypothetical protein